MTAGILSSIHTPADVHALSAQQLRDLCLEIRATLLDYGKKHGGHIGSNLGVVELTVALHRVFDSPRDRFIFDVSHQSYVHKMLTGRAAAYLDQSRFDEVTGFTNPLESEHDSFVLGHTGTSISLACGLAKTRDMQRGAAGESTIGNVIAIIGDGSLSSAIAFEGLNNAGASKRTNLLVILNDNEMSISENVGALNNHLAQLLSGKLYSSLREGGKKVFSGVPPIKELLKRTEEHIKGMVVPGTLFEELGFNYIGPVDGHDVLGLITTLKNMRDLKGPQFLHIMTKKGRGYEPAEKDPITFHAVPKFDPSSGCLPKSSGGLPSYSKIFGDWLCETAAKDNKLMAITPAMREGSGMVEFSRKFPDRYFDVAIAEQHAVTFAAGLAIGGYKPIVAIYSTFLQRAYDQVLHDVAIQKLPVLFAIDRAGIVGADGQTHQGAFDLSYLRCIPEMVIMTPSDENECRQMLYTGYHYNDGPSAVRYPRGNAVGVELTPLEKLPIGKGIVKRRGEKLAILNFGTLMPEAAKVAESLNATLVDMRFVKPLDEALILEMAASHEALVTVEENAIMGGAGSGVNEVLMAHRKPVPVLNIGLPDFFIPQGTQEEMRAELGLDAAGMEAKIKAWLA